MPTNIKLYDVLGVTPSASSDEIKKAFREQALRWHPDKNHGDVEVEKKFKGETRHAYEILIDPESCWEYDTKGPSTSRASTWSPPRRSTNRGLRPIRQPRFDPTNSDNDDDFMFMDEEYIERLFQEARAAHASQAGQAMNITRLGQNIAKNRQRGRFGFSSDSECSPSVYVIIFRLLFDIAIHVSAGAAAAAVGAHANGSPLTPRITKLGAIAGLTKSVIAGIVWTIGLLDSKPLANWSSGFGLSLFITLEVSYLVLHKIPAALVVAALVSGVPLWLESVNHGSALPEMFSWLYCFCIPCCCLPCYFLVTLPGTGPCFLIAFNAIAGAIFAGIASSMGVPICAPHTAAAAGAVYGTISCIPTSIESCMRYAVVKAMLEEPDDLETFRPLL